MEILANASGYQTAFKVPEGRHVVDTGVNRCKSVVARTDFKTKSVL